MALTAAQIFELNRMNSTSFKHQLGTLISDASDISASEITLAEGSMLVGNSSGVGVALDGSAGGNLLIGNDTTMVALDGSGDTKILIGNATTMASFALSGDVTMTNGGVVTVVDLSAVTGHLSVQETTPAGASPGHIIKGTLIAAGTFTGTNSGLIVKQYDADNTVVHNESELCGLYVNLKQLSAMLVGGKSALISAHNYGSGGDYQVVDFGLRLFGDLVDGIEITGGTVTSAIKLDTCTALTNVLKLADGVGCTVGSDGMTKDPEGGAEDGFIALTIGGVGYQIPVYTA